MSTKTRMRVGAAIIGRRLLPRVIALSVLIPLVALAAATPASADPVRIVTAGGLGHLSHDDETSAGFIGAGFQIFPEYLNREDIVGRCSPCTPGAAFDMTGTFTLSSFPGTAVIDGRSYDRVYYAGEVDVEAGSVIVPMVPVGEGRGASTGFTFTANVRGYADPGLTSLLFSTDLAGGGTVRADFFNYPPSESGPFVYPGGISLSGYDYRFEQTAPTPEPGSLVLFGSGAAWVAARWRRRRATAH